jgi:hypothetical protein
VGTSVWAGLGVVVGVLGLGTLGAASGCSAILGLDAKTLGDLDAGDGGGMTSETGGSDAGPGEAGPSSACGANGAITPGYHDITSATCWTTFDTTLVDPAAQNFAGAAFDGHYVYFVPGVMGSVARLDTTGDFASASAWSSYSPVGAQQATFNGAVFDGRYLYLVPAGMGVPAVRYDTKAAFGVASSWVTFDTSMINANTTDFAGGAFDGRYVYLAPSVLGNSPGVIARYDTHQSFSAATSWSTFDSTTLNTTISGFFGVIFDGRYAYFIPDGSADQGVAARYDTRASFTAASSWQTFSLIGVNKNAYGFMGGAFDGTSVYLAPAYNGNGSPGGTALRFDIAGAGFNSISSWSAFPPAQLVPAATSYFGATFDGRYVYFAPTGGGGQDNGFLLRYDTTIADFTSSAAWGSFDTTSLNTNAIDFAGAVFDGRYVYLVPEGTLVARFDARAPAPLPTLGDSGVPFYGSFF